LGLRLIDAAQGRRTGSLYQYVSQRGERFTMTPRTTVVVPERYGDIVYSFNGKGYRDDEPIAGPTRPVVLLGDSVSFGLGVAQERIYPARLEAQGVGEVVNLSMWAYDSCSEAQAFAEDGPSSPRYVVVQFFMNDLSVGSLRVRGAPTLRERLTIARNRLLYSSRIWLRAQQAAGGAGYLLLHDLRRRYLPLHLNADEPRHKRAYLTEHPDDTNVPGFTCLLAIASRARELGAPVLIVNTPAEVQLYDRQYDAISDRLEGFCRSNGLDFVDTLPDLRGAPRRERLFLDGVHLSAEGHTRVAALVGARLRGRS
jgi:hypothetical protein